MKVFILKVLLLLFSHEINPNIINSKTMKDQLVCITHCTQIRSPRIQFTADIPKFDTSGVQFISSDLMTDYALKARAVLKFDGDQKLEQNLLSLMFGGSRRTEATLKKSTCNRWQMKLSDVMLIRRIRFLFRPARLLHYAQRRWILILILMV